MRPFQKSYLRGFLIAGTVLFGIAFLINLYAKRYIDAKLNSAIVNNDSIAYRIGFEDLSVNVWTGYAGVENFYIIAKEKYERPPLNTININAAALRFSGIGVLKILLTQDVDIGKVHIEHPIITVSNVDTTTKNESDELPLNLYLLVKENFSSLRIGTLIIKNGSITLFGRDSANLFISLPKVNLQLTDIRADSSLTTTKRFMDFGGVTLSINNLNGHFFNGLYQINVPSFRFENRNSSLQIDSILLKPTIDKKIFAKKIGLQTDCLSLQLTNLMIKFSDVQDLILNQKISIDKIDVGSLQLHDYWDKNFPRRRTRQALHHTALVSLPYAIDIREVEMKSADIIYEELGEGSVETGSISFNRVSGLIKNISNINMSDTMKIHCSGYMLGETLIRADILLPLSEDRFITSMHMESFDMRKLNGMIKNLAPVKIKSGVITSINMYCEANDHSGSGSMTFKYSGLEVAILSDDKVIDRLIMSRIKNFIANKIVLEQDNPKKGVLRIGKIDYKRDQERNIINYSWNLAFSGIKSSIGLSEKQKELFQTDKK
ncbi:MAG: hypothetical protein H0V61_08625 [Chitinophagales bacterium]|nr:hypothetical protein [Chitinophagales bacterium]